PVVGDCKLALSALLEIADTRFPQRDWHSEHAEWLKTTSDWITSRPLTYQQDPHGPIKPQAVVESLRKLTRGEAIIVTDVGQHQMWTAQFYSFTKPRTLLTSGGLGTMGYGLPASIGAQLAYPDKLVIAIVGDGSIQMNIQELITAVSNNLPVKIVILNNRYLGMVRQWQELFYNRVYASTNMEAQPDFVKLAEAYGAEGYRIDSYETMDAILETALSSAKTSVIDVRVEREENVYPMVPAGAALDEMLLV
ncbi:MAG: acetolactate synthase large subunit, partial [Desulfovibrio sp.]|nr:acetolactate synthase large subunit [Desulfovibrio sp.]